jgi:hypothetical protein
MSKELSNIVSSQKEAVMFAKSSSTKAVKNIHKVVLVVALLAALFFSSPAGHANAFAYTNLSGSAGRVDLPSIAIGDRHITCVMYLGAQICTPVLVLDAEVGPTVYRSPASYGSQIVQALYVVEQWDGAQWVIVQSSGLIQRTIGSAQSSVQFPAPVLQVEHGTGYFRLSWVFSWHTSSGGLLGTTSIISDRASDFTCVTSARLCQEYAGYVRTGGHLTGKW